MGTQPNFRLKPEGVVIRITPCRELRGWLFLEFRITSLKGAIDEKMFFSKMAIDSDIFSSCWSIPPSTG